MKQTRSLRHRRVGIAWIVGIAGIAGAVLGSPLAASAASATTSTTSSIATIAARVATYEKRAGLLALYVDRPQGKIWLEVPAPKDASGEVGRYLYVEALVTGMGANPVGLDRGQVGDGQVVTLRRVGARLLVEVEVSHFRAQTGGTGEARAVRESFAPSVIWGGEVAAVEPDGRALVDFTSFVVRDAHGIVPRLKSLDQGSWALDGERSAADLDGCMTFPENIELEAVLTYTSQEPGDQVRATAPVAGAMTFVQHQTLLRLPEGYRPRRNDPRSGSFGVDFLDYSAPLTGAIDGHWVARHRLEKIDPTAARSRVKKPLVYYVDSAAPEPIRSALVEGASWWKEAFEKAGFIDAFRVEVLPEGASPLDVRYNVVEWVHRSTRGWSYGGGIIDPRTGEMINGHVTLGSLRIRQDRLLFEGLLGTRQTGTGAADDPVQLSLARIRQLAAHEVGHSLGLNHNFAASTYGRASVMDYPAPLVGVTAGGDIDVSHAYATGIGEWDVQAIRYAYTEFPHPADAADGSQGGAQSAESVEKIGLDDILRENIRHGLIYVTDEDARPPGAAQPLGNLWDNGAEPVAGLEQTIAVRRIALARFGVQNVAFGRPLTTLEEVLAPVYFHHRYQLEAAVKVVGGLDYAYSVRGVGPQEARPVDAAWQRRALATVLSTLTPTFLDIPEAVVAAILPRAPGAPANVETFTGRESPAFDPLSAAAAAADMAVSGLLQPERAARLVDFHRRDAALPSFEDVLGALIGATFGGAAGPGSHAGGVAAAADSERQAEIRRVVQWVVVRRMLDLAGAAGTSPGVRSRVEAQLDALRGTLAGHAAPRGTPASRRAAPAGDAERAHRAMLEREITRFLDRREDMPAAAHTVPTPAPPGMPIGGAGADSASRGEGPGLYGSGLPPSLAGCSWDAGSQW